MQDFLSRITDQITTYWNKLTTKNKIQIISAIVVGIIALIILGFVISRPKMVEFATGIEPDKMSQIKSALEDQAIAFEISDDATTLYVDVKRQQDVALLAANLGVISDSEMTYDEALDNSLTATTSEKELKFQLAFEDELNRKIEVLDTVRNAYVKLHIDKNNQSIFDEDKKSSASVFIESTRDLTEDEIMGIVNFMRNAVSNLAPEDISIVSTKGELLYDGQSANGFSGNINNKLEYKLAQEQMIGTSIMSSILSLGLYNDAQVAVNLEIDFDEKETTSRDYSDGTPIKEYQSETSGSSSDASGVPGTDSNGVVTYPTDNGSGSESSSSVSDIEYVPDETLTNERKSVGSILYDQSSVTVVLNEFSYIYEETVEGQELLDNISWEEYKNQNSGATELQVSENIVQLIKTASKIDNIKVLAYNVPMFISKEVIKNPIINYIPVIVIVLLIGLLGYAVYKGTEPVEITEIEPELSVEDMLASTKEKQELEDIEFDDKSDTRKQIEKFVDENPEAVALMLRNWINEDWE